MKKKKKRRKYLLGLVILAIVAVASFVHAYLTTTQAISVSGADADIAAVEADGSPSWPAMHGNMIGTIETTSLFKVTPDPSYTGDLLISVNLTNADELIKCYRFLMMKIGIFTPADDQVGRTELLTIKNGTVSFELPRGAGWADFYRVKITSGSFHTLKGTAGAGESFSPSFWCEASQR